MESGCLTLNEQLCSYIMTWQEHVAFLWDDDDLYFIPDEHAQFDFNSTRSLKQQSTDSNVVNWDKLSEAITP